MDDHFARIMWDPHMWAQHKKEHLARIEKYMKVKRSILDGMSGSRTKTHHTMVDSVTPFANTTSFSSTSTSSSSSSVSYTSLKLATSSTFTSSSTSIASTNTTATFTSLNGIEATEDSYSPFSPDFMTDDAYYPPPPAHLSPRLDSGAHVKDNDSTLPQLPSPHLDIPVANSCHACRQNQGNKVCLDKLCSRCCKKHPEKCIVHSHNEGKLRGGVSLSTKKKGRKPVCRNAPVFNDAPYTEYVKKLDMVINENMTTDEKKSLYIAYKSENVNPARDLTKARKIVPLHWDLKHGKFSAMCHNENPPFEKFFFVQKITRIANEPWPGEEHRNLLVFLRVSSSSLFSFSPYSCE
jgi:hypothetical protein